jgi:hypothetical protein
MTGAVCTRGGGHPRVFRWPAPGGGRAFVAVAGAVTLLESQRRSRKGYTTQLGRFDAPLPSRSAPRSIPQAVGALVEAPSPSRDSPEALARRSGCVLGVSRSTLDPVWTDGEVVRKHFGPGRRRRRSGSEALWTRSAPTAKWFGSTLDPVWTDGEVLRKHFGPGRRRRRSGSKGLWTRSAPTAKCFRRGRARSSIRDLLSSRPRAPSRTSS